MEEDGRHLAVRPGGLCARRTWRGRPRREGRLAHVEWTQRQLATLLFLQQTPRTLTAEQASGVLEG